MLSFKSASFTVESVEPLDLFTLKTRNTVARESRVGLLGLLTMETRAKHTFTCKNGNGLLALLNMGLTLFTSKSGRTASTHGGRGRTTAHGRGCHGLLNMGFENLDGGKGLRGSGMGLLARDFFTFKSKTSSEREAFAWA